MSSLVHGPALRDGGLQVKEQTRIDLPRVQMTAVVDGRPGETPTIARGACGGRRGGLGGKAARADRSGDAPTKRADRAVLSDRVVPRPFFLPSLLFASLSLRLRAVSVTIVRMYCYVLWLG